MLTVTGVQTCALPISAVSDRECAKHKVCDDAKNLEYQTKAAGTHHDRECATTAVCTELEWETRPPSAAENRLCDTLTTCDFSTHYESKKETATTNRVCSEIRTCDAGSRQTRAPTTTTDRNCQVCDAGKFKTSAGNAETCDACGTGQYQNEPGASTSRRACTGATLACSTARAAARALALAPSA